MGYDLKNTNTTEKTMGNKWFLGTNLGRVYINSCVKDYELLSPNELRIGTNTITLPPQTQYENIIYTHSLLRAYNVRELSEYFKITDFFMEGLIRENINCSFEDIPFLKNIKLSDTDKHSLLKPVYYRYVSTKRNNPLALKVIQEKLSKRNKDSSNIDYETMVLYDVPCIITKDSRLRILDNFWIDISEALSLPENKNIYYEFNCISLGVKKFDKVKIIFEEATNWGSDNMFYGKQIKEIILTKD